MFLKDLFLKVQGGVMGCNVRSRGGFELFCGDFYESEHGMIVLVCLG